MKDNIRLLHKIYNIFITEEKIKCKDTKWYL